MSEITRGQFPEHLLAAARIMAGEAYKAYPQVISTIFDMRRSDRASEEGVMFTGSGLATVKNEGAQLSLSGIQQGALKRFVHATYGKAYAVTMEMLDDDQAATKVSELATRDMVKRMGQTKDIIGTNIINRAFTSAYANGFDGKVLCASDHVLGGGGSGTNLLATAADLSEASLEQAFIELMAMKDENGIVMPISAKKLLIPSALKFEAHRILKSLGRVGTADNDINAINSMNMLPDPEVNVYLDDPDAWFLLTDADNSLIHYQQKDLTMDSHNDFMTKNLLVSGIERYSFGWMDWRGVFGTPGA